LHSFLSSKFVVALVVVAFWLDTETVAACFVTPVAHTSLEAHKNKLLAYGAHTEFHEPRQSARCFEINVNKN
jgi:hypothetical protein